MPGSTSGPTRCSPSSRAVPGVSGGMGTVTVTLTVVVWNWMAVTVTRVGGWSPARSESTAMPTTAATAVMASPAAVITTHGHRGQRGFDVGTCRSFRLMHWLRHDCLNRYVFATSNVVNMCCDSCCKQTATVAGDFGSIAGKHRYDGARKGGRGDAAVRRALRGR